MAELTSSSHFTVTIRVSWGTHKGDDRAPYEYKFIAVVLALDIQNSFTRHLVSNVWIHLSVSVIGVHFPQSYNRKDEGLAYPEPGGKAYAFAVQQGSSLKSSPPPRILRQ